MLSLILLALAPVFAITIYVYVRDKYEKEPLKMLLLALGLGMLSVIPVIFVEQFLDNIKPNLSHRANSFYDAFIIAGCTEEIFKYLALYLLIWRSKAFNEKFDGIVYAVFVSLGFAAIENIMYVTNGGLGTGLVRAFVSVPAHALFGVTMGYYFGLAKFYPEKQKQFIFRALFYPIVLHGYFDFILMLQDYYLLFTFIPYVIFLYIDGLKKMKNLSARSVYKD